MMIEFRKLEIGNLLAQEAGKDALHKDSLVLSGAFATTLVLADVYNELDAGGSKSNWKSSLCRDRDDLGVMEGRPVAEDGDKLLGPDDVLSAAHRGLTFDMSGGPKGAKRPLGRPLDGGVRRHFLVAGHGSTTPGVRAQYRKYVAFALARAFDVADTVIASSPIRRGRAATDKTAVPCAIGGTSSFT